MDLETIIRIIAKSYCYNFTVIQPPFSGLEHFDSGLRKALDPGFDFETFGREIFKKLSPAILVLTVDEFNCGYGLVRPRDKAPVYLLGPIVRIQITEEIVRRIHSRYGISRLEQFMRIYQGLRIEYDTNVQDLVKNLHAQLYPEVEFVQKEIPNFFPLRMLTDLSLEEKAGVIDQLKLQEKLRQEMLLTDAVAAGDSKQAMQALSQLEGFLPNTVFHDPYLDLKHQALEANAICKHVVCASQKVHPLYPIQIHKSYALQISAAESIQALTQLTRQMVLSYCECARDNSLEAYSPLIRRVIEHIRLESNGPLSLRSLAEACHVNASYLSNLFRIETGMTLTEYINQHRIEKSLPLLQYTQMSIAQVSESVGFLDENYFARIFKRIMDMPPKEFRKKHQE